MIIKKLVETNGNKKRAAIKLGCSTRTINRLIIKYKTQGKAAFVHGNRGRLPSKTIALGIKNKIIKLYIDEFSDANFTHFCEIIYEDYNIKISDTTLNKWLREENIISPKARKKTKKLLKKALNAKLNDTKSKKIKDDINEIQLRNETHGFTIYITKEELSDIINKYFPKEFKSVDDFRKRFTLEDWNFVKRVATDAHIEENTSLKQFEFEYPENKMLKLATEIKKIVEEQAQYVDWETRSDTQSVLKMNLIVLLTEYGYPPVAIDAAYKEIFEQAENFKKYNR